MKAAVATNRWNFALAMKNTSSGPSSVASLNIGCGRFLSISVSLPVVMTLDRHSGARPLRREPGIQNSTRCWIPGLRQEGASRNDVVEERWQARREWVQHQRSIPAMALAKSRAV